MPSFVNKEKKLPKNVKRKIKVGSWENRDYYSIGGSSDLGPLMTIDIISNANSIITAKELASKTKKETTDKALGKKK